MANPPIHEVRMGCVKAVIWENETPNGIRSSVTIARLYKDEQDNWKETGSFSRQELPLVQHVLGRVYEWLYARPKVRPNDQAEESADEPAA